jgi:hypothetical protein
LFASLKKTRLARGMPPLVSLIKRRPSHAGRKPPEPLLHPYTEAYVTL